MIQKPEDVEVLRRKGVLVVLADGMGGLEHGKLASQLTVDTVMQSYFEYRSDPRTGLEAAVKEANSVIFRRANQDGETRQMGSTVTAVAMLGESVVIGQVGDSRCYRIRDSEIVQVTRDHSLVRELLERGEIEKDSAQYTFHRNILTRGLGLREDVGVDVFELVGIQAGDTFLLSTDGLHELVSDSELQACVERRGNDLEQACDDLIEIARERGAPDNITVALVQVGSPAGVEEKLVPMRPVESGRQDSWLSKRPGALLPVTVFVSFLAGVALTLGMLRPSLLTSYERAQWGDTIEPALRTLQNPRVPAATKSESVDDLRAAFEELGFLAPLALPLLDAVPEREELTDQEAVNDSPAGENPAVEPPGASADASRSE